MKMAKSIQTGCLLAFALLCLAASGWSNELSIADMDRGLGELSFQRSLAGAVDQSPVATSAPASKERGTLTTDSIRGNGSRAGYVLSRSGVIPNSETVTVDGSMKSRGRDYYMDTGSGAIFFAEPVRTNQLVRVTYRHIPGQNGQSRTGSAPLTLNFGQNTSVGLTYAYNTTSKDENVDLVTYGLNLTNKLGGDSSMQNMLYITSPRESGRMTMDFQMNAQAQTPDAEGKSDSLFVHNSDLQTGRFGIKLNYQDVGKDFTGFTAMRQQGVAPDDVLRQLEKEKGVNRMGFQAGYDMGEGASAGLGWSKISDGDGDIMRQSLNIGSEQLKLSANFQDVSEGFKRFKDLGDSESGQWANQAGMSHSDVQLKYAPTTGMGGSFGFQRITDGSGDIVSRSFSFGDDQLKLSANFMSIDENFRQVRGAQGIQYVNQIGVDRSDIKLGFNPEKGIGGNIGLLRIADEGGEIVKRSLSIGDDRIKFNMNTQEVGQEFTRFQNLEDKQWARESGVKRTDMQLSLAPLTGINEKAAWNALNIREIEDESGTMTSRALNFAGTQFELSASDIKIDKDFARLRDLTTADHTEMALNIYRQFDPKAQAGNVHRNDLQHMVNEAGIERRNIRGGFEIGDMSASLQLLNVGDETGGIDRQAISVKGKNFNLSGLLQFVDEDFTRISRLAPIERTNFGNEYGMQRMNLSGDLTLGSGLKLGTSFARVSTDDAGLVKYGLSLSGKKLSVSANYQNIDPDFDRIMDLANRDRRQMALEQGMERYDVSIRYQLSDSIRIDSLFYDAKHSTEDLFRRQLTNDISYNPSRGPKLSIHRDQLTYGSPDSPITYLRQKYTMNHAIGDISFNTLYDLAETRGSLTEDDFAETQGFGFSTNQKRSTSVSGDWKQMRQTDGKFIDSYALTLKSKIGNDLDLSGTRSVLVTDQTERSAQEYGLSGTIFGDVTLAFKLGESLVDDVAIARTRELSIVPGGAKDYGIFKNVNWTFSLREIEQRGQMQTLAGAAKFEAEVKGAQIAYEHAAGLAQRNNTAKAAVGSTTMARSFSLKSDQDPSNPLRFNLQYRTIDAGLGTESIMRSYDIDWRLNSTSRLTYKFSEGTDPSNARNPIAPTLEHLRLTSAVSGKLDLVGEWQRRNDHRLNRDSAILSLGFAGQLSKLSAFEVSYGYDRLVLSDGARSAKTYKVKYDYQASSDQFLTLSGRYTDRSGAHPTTKNGFDEVQIQLDVKTLFN